MGNESNGSGSRPIVGIDPGSGLAIAVRLPNRETTGMLLLPKHSWETTIAPYMPAYVFIEQPHGGDPSITDKLRLRVGQIVNEVAPFDTARQLVPCNVWRAEVLDRGDATKEDAIQYAREHYPQSYGTLPFESHDLAEAFCIMEYGRRLVEGRLRREDNGLLVPLLNMAPPERGSSKPPKYRLAVEGGQRYPLLPDIPWRLIKDGGQLLYAALRVWASGYTAAITYCADGPQPFSVKGWYADARSSIFDLNEYVSLLVKADLAYYEHGALVFRPAEDPRRFNARGEWIENADRYRNLPMHKLFRMCQPDDKSARALLQQWAKGGDPPLRPSNWKDTKKRGRYDARWGKGQCETCGTYALASDETICQSCTNYEAEGDRREDAATKQEAIAARASEDMELAQHGERHYKRLYEDLCEQGLIDSDEAREALSRMRSGRIHADGYQADVAVYTERAAAIRETGDVDGVSA